MRVDKSYFSGDLCVLRVDNGHFLEIYKFCALTMVIFWRFMHFARWQWSFYARNDVVALCHNEQTAALLLNFGFGHVLQYTPFILHFSALHFTHSYTTLEGVPKFRHTLS